MTKSRGGALLLLIGTFVLGGLLGGTLTSWGERRSHDQRRDRPRPTYVERLSQDLDLTPDQRERIQQVLDRHQPAMDSLWAQIRPQFESERQVIRQEIITLLTAEQQAKYAAILQRQDSLRRAGQERNRNGRP